MTAATARRIAGCFSGRFEHHYVASKLRTDPLYDAIGSLLQDSTLPLLDPGCGLGLLAHSLRARGIAVPVCGLDYDSRKIEAAETAAAAAGLVDIQFRQHDFTDGLPAHSGNVCLLDILQYADAARQQIFLTAAAERVAAGGLLIIRSGLRDDSLRFRVTHWCDRWAKWTFWMKENPAHYPAAEDFHRILGPFGSVEITPLWGATPFNNHLIILRRARAEASPGVLPSSDGETMRPLPA